MAAEIQTERTEQPASKALATAPSSSPNKYASGNVRLALADRMNLSDALEVVSRMIQRYPNGGANAGDGYLGGLAAVLASYPRSVAMRADDPLKGVPRETRFLPTPADVIAWCERETEELRRIVRPVEHSEEIRRQAAVREEEERQLQDARAKRPTYEELRAKYGPNWGISNPDKPAPPTREECRQKLIGQIGQEAFDAIPDAGYTGEQWKKLHAPKPVSEAAE